MKLIYLPIRSFGDFIITASIIKNNFIDKVPIVLPSYMMDIYQSINGDEIFEKHDNVNLINQPAIFELYKVKDLKNLKRLINDSKIIFSFFNTHNDATYMVDYSSKRLFFNKASLVWPIPTENIYTGKTNLLLKYGLISVGRGNDNIIQSICSGTKTRILILPDSRIKSKSIDDDLISTLINTLDTYEICVAEFSTTKSPDLKRILYSNFNELFNLISSYDLIISAESLPYHLAYYLNKQHFVIYNVSRHFKSTFMTPFMLKNNSYSTFMGSNAVYIAEKIKNILNIGFGSN